MHKSTMRAVGYEANLPIQSGNSLVDAEVDVPAIGDHDLLVEVRAVSVNPVDVKTRQTADPDGTLRILGFDASGVVRSVGSAVTLFSPGDEVFYAGTIDRPGTDSEFHAVDERIVGRKPTNLSFAEAAALPLTSITAWEGLVDKLRLGTNDKGVLLVVGATGGVGSMVVQLAHAMLPNVTVIATASGAEGEAWMGELGADVLVDHHKDLRAQVEAAAPEGVDWIFTTESSGKVDDYIELLRPFGQIMATGDPEALDILPMKDKALSWHWEFMFARPLTHDDRMIAQHDLLDEVARLVESGQLRSTLTTVLEPFSADRLREAHRLVEEGHSIGKVVVSFVPEASD